jgi:hypothetical protein
MSAVWYIKLGENNQGPYSLKNLNDLAQAGIITRESFIKSEQMNNWVKASDLPGLSFPVIETSFNEPPPLQSPPPPNLPFEPPPLQPAAKRGGRRSNPLKTILLIVLTVGVLAVIGFIGLIFLNSGSAPGVADDNGRDTATDAADQNSFAIGDPYTVEEPIRQWLSSLEFNEPYELVFVDELDYRNTGQDANKVILVYDIVSSYDNRFTVLLGVAYSEWFARLYIKPVAGQLTVTDFEEIAPVGSQD